MRVKSLVIVYSYHHGNTARIARAMADALGAEVKTHGDVRPEELGEYELVGFGSGIDSSRHYKPLLDLADALPHAAGRRAFIFSTCGIPASIFGKGYIENYAEESHAALRKKLMSKGYTVAGEFRGQFHHLRQEADMRATFSGELGEMFQVTARAVRLEIAADPVAAPEVISMYWGTAGTSTGTMQIDLGDLLSGEERHVVVRLRFGRVPAGALVPVRVRAVWHDQEKEVDGPWQEVAFEGADNIACSAEPRFMAVMHWVGLHHAEKTRAQALALFRRGDMDGAVRALEAVAKRIREYAGNDHDLVRAVEALEELRRTFVEKRMTEGLAKETLYSSHLGSRMQRDHRHPHQGT